ncbi:MAG: hypothetical protein N3F06_00055 [Nitrososphaerales archaeon]|nr:hypothetical protein [Nitrososphaerales archaeon]
MEDLRLKLENSKSFDEVFDIVKSVVDRSMNMHRAGLSLVLGELPNYIGAYHVMGSNFIVLNHTLLDAVKALARSRLELNSFIFSILLHEYLHSLGFVNEAQVRSIVAKLCEEHFGPEHLVTKFSRNDLFKLYPELKHLGLGRWGSEFKIVKEFDRSSMPYIN